MKRTVGIFVGFIAIVAIALGFGSFFILGERQQAIVTQFGEPIGSPITEAGLHFKTPFVQKVRRFDRRILEWDGDAEEIVTKDKKTIFVDTTARWKISDPLVFMKTVHNEMTAQSRLDDILDGAVRRLISENNLIEAVRASNRAFTMHDTEIEGFQNLPSEEDTIRVGRDQVIESILAACRTDVGELGIELVDVRIRRIDYSEKVRRSVYERMIAERNQIADKYRSEGQGTASEIDGKRGKELQRVGSEASREASVIRGEGDAEATRIYAEAYGADPEFYAFYQTLDTYRSALGNGDTALVLSTKSNLLKYLLGPELQTEAGASEK